MRPLISPLVCLALIGLTGCSSDTGTESRSQSLTTVAAGERASIGHLTYSIVDSQILTQLGDEASPRVPHDRFVLVQIAVTNSSNVDNPIPAVALVADSGKEYNELSDGSGVSDWLGLVRHVGPGQTERGYLAFDAPAAHYKVKFSDETTEHEILADLPLSYAHEKVNDALVPTTEFPEVKGPTGEQKKK